MVITVSTYASQRKSVGKEVEEFLKEGEWTDTWNKESELESFQTHVSSLSESSRYHTIIEFRDEYHYFTPALYAPSYRLRPIPYADR